MFCIIKKEIEEEIKIKFLQVQKIQEDVCSKLCKYPEHFSPEEWEDGANIICESCPLNQLVKED